MQAAPVVSRVSVDAPRGIAPASIAPATPTTVAPVIQASAAAVTAAGLAAPTTAATVTAFAVTSAASFVGAADRLGDNLSRSTFRAGAPLLVATRADFAVAAAGAVGGSILLIRHSSVLPVTILLAVVVGLRSGFSP